MSYAAEVYRTSSEATGGATEADLVGAVATLRDEGVVVRYLGSVALPGDEMIFYLFDAASRQSVEEVLRRLGVTAERIVHADATRFLDRGL